MDTISKRRIESKEDKTRRLLKGIVCARFGVTLEELNTARGKRQVIDAKRTLAYLMRKHLKDTYHRIGVELNGLGHASIFNLLRTTEDFMSVNDPIKKSIEAIEREFFNKPNKF
jgi:chromosomal replication initiation ATPase DnaA